MNPPSPQRPRGPCPGCVWAPICAPGHHGVMGMTRARRREASSGGSQQDLISCSMDLVRQYSSKFRCVHTRSNRLLNSGTCKYFGIQNCSSCANSLILLLTFCARAIQNEAEDASKNLRAGSIWNELCLIGMTKSARLGPRNTTEHRSSAYADAE